MAEEFWLVDTGWACGGVDTVDGVVVNAPPVFRKFIGLKISSLQQRYRVEEIKKEVLSG